MTAHSIEQRLHLATLPRLLFGLLQSLQFLVDVRLVLENSGIAASIVDTEEGGQHGTQRDRKGLEQAVFVEAAAGHSTGGAE